MPQKVTSEHKNMDLSELGRLDRQNNRYDIKKQKYNQ